MIKIFGTGSSYLTAAAEAVAAYQIIYTQNTKPGTVQRKTRVISVDLEMFHWTLFHETKRSENNSSTCYTITVTRWYPVRAFEQILAYAM